MVCTAPSPFEGDKEGREAQRITNEREDQAHAVLSTCQHAYMLREVLEQGG